MRFGPVLVLALGACTASQDLGSHDPAADAGAGNSSGGNDPSAQPPGGSGAQKRVFVTSKGVSGTFAGAKSPHEAADAVCAAAAVDAKLGGKWVAWLSARDLKGTMIRARDRIPASVTSWTLVDGKTVVFANRDALFASTLAAIDQDEFGAKVPDGTTAWTGSLIGGGPVQRYNCGNWSFSVADKGVVGAARPEPVKSSDTQVYWAGPETEVPLVAQYCDSPASFYCFEI